MTNLKAKLNGKKGFTLIEMLVVIAIIAVLVAIIIPTVTSATSKAAAATNAANLRSLKAEIVTALLANDGVEVKDDKTLDVSGITAPAMKKVDDTVVDCTSGETITSQLSTADVGTSGFVVTYNDATKEVTVYYCGKNIEELSNYADTGSYEVEDD